MNRFYKAVLPVAILAAGVLVLVLLMRTRPEPSREVREELSALVETETVQAQAHRIAVRASGTVTPARQVAIAPEIAGRVVWVSPQLLPGGRFEVGDPMIRIDAREHELAVRQQLAEVDRVRTELEIELGRVAVAQREWEIFAEEEDEDSDRALALRQPQLRTARASLEGAKSGLERAELNVQRTRLRAPFNAVVIDKSVDVGQYVAPSAPVATLVGTDEFWVQVSIPIEQLGWIDVPGVAGVADDGGSPARVWQKAGGTQRLREGRVVKLLGDVDPAGRMARVLVALDDPFGLRDPREERPRMPLLAGSYVEVEVLGRQLPAAIEIPRIALRDDSRVFIMDADDLLQVREVSVVWRDRDSILVEAGLEDGDRVVVSSVPAPTAGMKLRSRQDADGPAGADGEQGGAGVKVEASRDAGKTP